MENLAEPCTRQAEKADTRIPVGYCGSQLLLKPEDLFNVHTQSHTEQHRVCVCACVCLVY